MQLNHYIGVHLYNIANQIQSIQNAKSSSLKCFHFSIRSLLLSHPLAIKALVPGRLIILNYEEQVNLIGILLSFDTSAKEKTYSVLILVDESSKGKKESKAVDKKFNDFLSLASQSVSFPGCISADHQVMG